MLRAEREMQEDLTCRVEEPEYGGQRERTRETTRQEGGVQRQKATGLPRGLGRWEGPGSGKGEADGGGEEEGLSGERADVVRGRTEADRQYRTRLSSSSRARSRGPRREEEDGSEAMSSTRVRPTEAG